MNWELILVCLLTMVGVLFACYFLNRRLFSLMHKAEDEVRARCMQRDRLQIETVLDSFGVCQKSRSVGKGILTGIAKVMRVPPETLRADDKFCDLCLVIFPPDISVKPDRMIVFSYDLLDFISQYLNNEQYIAFLSALGVSHYSEDVIWSAISERSLSDLIRLMTEAGADS